MVPEYIARIDTSGRGRYDVTPLFADARAFAALVDDLLAFAQPLSFEIVAGIDALGFILGSALAIRAGTGFIPIRKEGKLPVLTEREAFVDYTGTQKALELRPDAVLPGQRILVVDEWIETGAQVSCRHPPDRTARWRHRGNRHHPYRRKRTHTPAHPALSLRPGLARFRVSWPLP